MESDVIEGIYGEIVRGGTKGKSSWVTDDESGQCWDDVAAEVADIQKRNPHAQFDMVHEIP